MEGAIKGVYCSLPRIIATPIQYSFIAYFWEMFVTEFGWTFSEYSKLYWIYTFTQVISYTALGYLLYEIVKGLDEDRKLKYSKWIEMASIVLLSVTFFLLILLPICWYIIKLPVRTIIWNLLCRARTTARNYLTPYETYPFEKAERDKRIRIIRSMFPDLLDKHPNAKSRFILQSTLGQDPELAVNSLPRLSAIDWSKVFRHLSLPFRVCWNLLCRGRTTARNYLTPYESYPAENAERQKRLRIIRSMFPELANPLPNAAPNPQPEPSTNPIPVINTLPKPSLLSRVRSLFKPKSKLRSPYDFPFSPVEFGGVPDLTATWTIRWYGRKDPLVPEVEYKPSLRERLNYFGNRGSYNVAKYDPPVPEMYIPPEPEPSPIPSTSKSTPTSSPPQPIPPIKRDSPPEPKSIPKPNQGPIPYITPCPAPVDSIPEPEPITEPEVDSIFDPKPKLVSSPIRATSHNIPRLNNRPANSFSRRLKSFFDIFVSRRFILYTMIALHSIGTSSFDLCNRALPTYIYPEHIVANSDGNKYDKNDTLRNTLNTISVGVFVGASFFVILLFSFVKNFAHSKTAFSNTFFIISILFFFGQIPVLYFFHEKAEGNSNAEDSMNNHQCLELCTDNYLKLACLAIFHTTTLFRIFTYGILANYVSTNMIGEYVSIMGLIVSILVVGFAFVSWMHIAIVSFISDACRYLFNYGDGQILVVAACIIGQTVIHHLFGPYGYWWNVASIFQFLILIITGIANMIFLTHTYVMLDNLLKNKAVNNWKWLVLGIFYSIVSLVVYSAIYINFNSYYNNEIMESAWNLPSWIYHYDFPISYKSISFIFQLANVAAFAVYYLIHSCDACKKRLEERSGFKRQVKEANQTANEAGKTAEFAKEVAMQAKSQAAGAQLVAAHALEVAEKANKTAKEAKETAESAEFTAEEAKKVAGEAQLVAAHALEVAAWALKVSSFAQNDAAEAIKISSSAKNLGMEALNFATTALNIAGLAQRDASSVKRVAEEALDVAKDAKFIVEDVKTDILYTMEVAERANQTANEARSEAAGAKMDAKDAKKFVVEAQNLASAAESYASIAKKFAEDALNYASDALKVAKDTHRDVENVKSVASNAKTIAVYAHRDSEWAKKFAEKANKTANMAKTQAKGAQMDASYAKIVISGALADAKDAHREAGLAREAAEKAKDASMKAQKEAEDAKNGALEAARKAEVAKGNAEQQAGRAERARRGAEAAEAARKDAERIIRAFSETERKNFQIMAAKFKEASDKFATVANAFQSLASKIKGREFHGNVKAAIDRFKTAAKKFGKKDDDDTVAVKFKSLTIAFSNFATELKENPDCVRLNLSFLPVLLGLQQKVHSFKVEAGNFVAAAITFQFALEHGAGSDISASLAAFKYAALNFHNAGVKFQEFAEGFQNVSNYFYDFVSALPTSPNCESLKNKTQEFKNAANQFKIAVDAFAAYAKYFSESAEGVDPKDKIKFVSIKSQFKQAATTFRDAAETLYNDVKVIV